MVGGPNDTVAVLNCVGSRPTGVPVFLCVLENEEICRVFVQTGTVITTMTFSPMYIRFLSCSRVNNDENYQNDAGRNVKQFVATNDLIKRSDPSSEAIEHSGDIKHLTKVFILIGISC